MKTVYITLAITLEKDVEELAAKVAQRPYTLDGVRNCEVIIEHGENDPRNARHVESALRKMDWNPTIVSVVLPSVDEFGWMEPVTLEDRSPVQNSPEDVKPVDRPLYRPLTDAEYDAAVLSVTNEAKGSV